MSSASSNPGARRALRRHAYNAVSVRLHLSSAFKLYMYMYTYIRCVCLFVRSFVCLFVCLFVCRCFLFFGRGLGVASDRFCFCVFMLRDIVGTDFAGPCHDGWFISMVFRVQAQMDSVLCMGFCAIVRHRIQKLGIQPASFTHVFL